MADRLCGVRLERANGSRDECDRPARHAGDHECHCGRRWEPRIRPFPASFYRLTDESAGGDFTYG